MRSLLQNLIVLSCVIVLLSCSTSEKKDITKATIEAESSKANAFFERSFDEYLQMTPMTQSQLGIKDDYDKWDDLSDAHDQEMLEMRKRQLQYLVDSLDRDALNEQTKLSYDLFKRDAENNINDFKWRYYDYPVNQMFGLQSRVPAFLINIHQITDSSDAADYIARLNGIEKLFDQLITGLKKREELGIVPPKFVFPRVIEDCKNVLKGAPFERGAPGTLLEDFDSKLAKLDLDEASKLQLEDKATEALKTKVKPAYESLMTFLKEQEQRATTDDGAWKFPDGNAFYENALKRTTTTDLTAEEIYEIGLEEVDRIHGEMHEIMDKVGFEGSLQDFFKFLREDERFYYPNTEAGKQAYLDSAKAIIDNMRSKLDELFITKPEASIKVKRVEKFRENSAGKAFYQSPAPDGSRPGVYYVNLANTKNMPKYEMEAIAYHEGIPGHHMDRTIAQELDNIPEFRKYGGYTAFVEGWGLYSEYLPKELGMYSNPYADFGRLAMELWRACRLVVDTGIHYKKWTRQEGIDYYMENTPASERECVRMVERHIVMPSQATAYKIGMMKILELRAQAKEKLGDKFDIREFHEVVLTNGSVPLNTLDTLVTDWIASKM